MVAALALALAGVVLGRELERRAGRRDAAFALTLAAAIGGIVGARVYWFFEHVGDTSLTDSFSGAGFTWYGGVLGGAAAVLLVARVKRVPVLPLLGASAPALALGYGIGRVACQLAGDGTYGRASDLPWAMSYPHGEVPTTQRVHPTPVYETLSSLLIFALLWRLRERMSAGRLFALYLVLAGFERFLVEFLRRNEHVLVGLTQPQLFAAAMMLVGLAVLAWRPRFSAVLAGLSLLLAAVLAGCGGDDSKQPGTPAGAAGNGEGLAHIHGLGVRDGNLYIATHYGLWIAPSGQLKPKRFSDSRQDIMGFSLISAKRFIGSGHPDPADGGQPPNLGLIESRDGGRTWKNISLLGKADFHVLEASGTHVYGVNSADGRLMASTDGGRTWKTRTPPAGVFGLAIDPRDPGRVVASTEKGVFSSPNGGAGWRPVRDDIGGLLAWPRADALYLLGGDGGVQASRDGGHEWKAAGNIGGQPAAFLANADELYAALHDGTVKVSTDGGATWTLRATP